MKTYLVSFFSGVLFAIGLAVSGMTQPAKVVGFLDVTGNWDPSLAFVMGGALLVNVILFRVARRRSAPLFESRYRIPTSKIIDRRLVLGAALFGLGWGLGGFCPGPALTSVVTGTAQALTFVGAMVGGIFLHRWVDRKLLRRGSAEANEAHPLVGERIEVAGE